MNVSVCILYTLSINALLWGKMPSFRFIPSNTRLATMFRSEGVAFGKSDFLCY